MNIDLYNNILMYLRQHILLKQLSNIFIVDAIKRVVSLIEMKMTKVLKRVFANRLFNFR